MYLLYSMAERVSTDSHVGMNYAQNAALSTVTSG